MTERINRENKTGANSGKRSSISRARLSPDQQSEYDTKVSLTKVVSLRLANDDHEAYMAKVQASGMGRSAFFRECVLDNKTQVVARPKPSADHHRLVYLANKIGNNVNQLAHRTNADYLAGVVSESTYARILSELQTLTQFMKAAIKNAD